jgi:hypothetical protein
MRQIPGDCPGKTYTVLKVTVNPGLAKAKTGGPLTIKDRKLAVCQDHQSCESAGADVEVIVPVDADFVTVSAPTPAPGPVPHLPRTWQGVPMDGSGHIHSYGLMVYALFSGMSRAAS